MPRDGLTILHIIPLDYLQCSLFSKAITFLLQHSRQSVQVLKLGCPGLKRGLLLAVESRRETSVYSCRL